MKHKLKANLPIIIAMIVALIVFKVATFIAMSPEWAFQSGVKEVDDIVFHAIYEIHLTMQLPWLLNVLGPLAFVITQLGTLYAVAIMGGIAYLKKNRVLAFKLLASGLSAYGAAGFMKMIVQRPRPMNQFPGDYARYDQGAGGFGYPSGHTAVAFAIALCLYFVLPGRARLLLFAAALLVGVSRIYLGVHFPLDVIGGAAIGLFCGLSIELFSRLFLKRFGK